LKTYGLLGAADLEYRAGNYDKVLAKELAGGVLAQVEALAKAGKSGGKVQVPDYEMTGQILGLVLRAQVQKGHVKEAQDTLRLIQRLSGPEGQIPDPTAALRSLLRELQAQVRDLRAKGDQAKLRKTVDTFSTFIDTLAGRKAKALARNDLIFLANCYNSLEQYDKAAQMYAQVQPPKGPPVLDPARANDEKAKEEFEKAKQLYERDRSAYWFLQVLYGKALRKSGKLEEAKKVLKRVLKTPEAAGKLLAQKEEIHLLEDRGLWGTAINQWGKFIKNPQLLKQAREDAEAKRVYFESYYHYAYSWYEYSQSAKVKGTAREKKFLQVAADYILRLKRNKNQEGWRIAGPLFRELLRQEPALNQAYEALKKGS
jgi:hypothetical protein